MANTHQFIYRRLVAVILLLSHALMSCANPTINPSHEASGTETIINQEYKKSTEKLIVDPELLPVVVSGQSVKEKESLKEEDAKPTTGQELPLLKTIQKNLSRPSQVDLETKKLETSLVSQRHSSKPLQLTIDNKRQVVNPIHISVDLKPLNKPLSTENNNQSQKRTKNKQTQKLGPVEQDLHTRILQTMQNPIWKRHFLNSQIANTKLLTNTPPIQAHYQLARVQEAFQVLAPMWSLQIREGQQLKLLQDMGYWWGVVQESIPGFSRSSVLPVLYPEPIYINQLGHYVQHTIEELLHAPQEVQQQLIHIFSSSQTLQNAFVYTGKEMGLVGGGFWSFVGSCIASVVSSAALGFGSGFVSGYFSGGMGPSGVVLGTIFGIGAAIAGCIMGVAACVKKYKVRQKTRNELEFIDQRIKKVCEQALQEAQNEVKKARQDLKAYKNKQKKANILQRINGYKDSIHLEISKLEQWGKGIKEQNWFLSANWPSNKELEEPKFMWDEDFEYLEQCIESRKEDVKKIDTYIQEAKDTFMKQAWEGLQVEKNLAKNEINSKKDNLTNSMNQISASTGLADAKDNLAALKEQVNNNIAMYKNWQKEESLYEEDINKINEYIKAESDRFLEFEIEEQLITYAEQADNILNIQQIADPQLTSEDLQNILANAADQGDYWILYYAFHYQNKSPNTMIDEEENTILHRAILDNQIKVAKLCLEYGADKFIKNRGDEDYPSGRTPIDLAANNLAIKKLLE